MNEEDPEIFGKVAAGNLVEDVAFSNGITMKAGPINVIYARGNCLTCGCPPDKMPMINRGTGWCCENHRKEQLK